MHTSIHYDCLIKGFYSNYYRIFDNLNGVSGVFTYRLYHTGKCKSTGAGCNELVQSKLRTGVRLKWRKR